MNILSLTQVLYLDILCHVTYILDTLQDDLDRHARGQQLALGYVDRHHLELDPFVQSYGDQVALSIPDSVCSDCNSPEQLRCRYIAPCKQINTKGWHLVECCISSKPGQATHSSIIHQVFRQLHLL